MLKLINKIVITVLAATAVSCAWQPKSVEQPNVIIVLADNQAWGDVGFNGNQIVNTPAIDSLAQNGVVFKRFYISPGEAQTQTEILTGKYNIKQNTEANPDESIKNKTESYILPQLLKQNGYITSYFGKWSKELEPVLANAGFDRYFSCVSDNPSPVDDSVLNDYDQTLPRKKPIDDRLTDSVIDFITSAEVPFFTVVAYGWPTETFEYSTKYTDKYLRKGIDRKLAAIYANSENIDANISRIRSAMKRVGKLRSTIFIYMSDNGPDFVRYNGGLKGRKPQLDEGGLRVPFVITYPDGNLKHQLVQRGFGADIDLAPTIINLCSIAADTLNFDGISLTKVLFNSSITIPDRKFFTLYGYGGENMCVAVRTNQYLLTWNQRDTLLYDLVTDPCQINNIHKANNVVTDSLWSGFNNWLLKMSLNQKEKFLAAE